MNGSGRLVYADTGVVRTDFGVPTDHGLTLFVREVRSPHSDPARSVILLHGARVPSVPSFDLPVAHGSLAADLARRGATVFLMDARGYGFSDRLAEMDRPNGGGVSSVRADAVVRDIGQVVEAVRTRLSVETVSLLGWATGALWAGLYASLNADRLDGLILYNPVYGGVDGHPTWGQGSPLEDPDRPGQFNRRRFGTYRLCDAADTLAKWDASFPGRDIDACRDPAVRDAYVETALLSDQTSGDRAPRSYRAPSGALEDTFYAMRGRQLYDASLIRCRVLVVRCADDFLAREAEVALLLSHLVSARGARIETIGGASHYAHLDRPACGRDAVIAALDRFLGAAA